MIIGIDLFRVLTADADVSALVGERVFPNWIPKDAAMPAVRYAVASEAPVQTFDEATGALRHIHVQVDAYASDYASAEELADALESVLGDYKDSTMTSVQAGRRDLYEEDVALHRVSLTFSIWKGAV